MLRRLYTLADILVILTLLLAPFISAQFGFLRVLRAMRLVHSYHVLRDLRRETAVFRRNEELIVACVNLAVFIRSEEHKSELQSLMRISYAVFCLKKKNQKKNNHDSLT